MDHPNIRGLSGWQPRARGGFTVVWEARQDLFSRSVAVKVFQFGPAEAIYEAFAREASVIGQLSDHPGVVTAYDAGLLPDGKPYLLLELCTGGSLTPWLSPENRRTEEQICTTGVQVADALAAVHERGFLHRDVKPANILIDSFGNPRLADFGLASSIGADAVSTELLRMTPAYAPPEAFTRTPSTPSGDVYSLAATMYALLAGQPPRSAATSDVQQVHVSIDSLTRMDVNWFLADILASALAVDPATRPTAAELRDRLAELPARRARPPKPRLVIAPPPTSKPGRSVLAGRPAASDQHEGVGIASSVRASAQAPETRHRRGRRRVAVLAVAAISVIVAATGAASLLSQPALSSAPAAVSRSAPAADLTELASSSTTSSDNTDDPAPSQSPTAERVGDRDVVAKTAEESGPIEVNTPTSAAKPFETVRIQGSYPGGGNTFLQVQHWADGRWQTFPVPAKSDEAGQFTVFVELGQPDRYRLRVRDPQSDVASDPFVLVIKPSIS